jgi:hypothetical protein
MEYISIEHQKSISQRYRIAAILVLAHAVTVILFIVIARFIQPQEIVPGSERLIQMVPAVVIALTLGVVVFRRVWLSRVVFGSAARLGVNAVLNKLMQMTIICAALSELIAILGFLFYLLLGDYQYSLILSVASLLLIFYTAFPRRGEWERAAIASADAQTK